MLLHLFKKGFILPPKKRVKWTIVDYHGLPPPEVQQRVETPEKWWDWKTILFYGVC